MKWLRQGNPIRKSPQNANSVSIIFNKFSCDMVLISDFSRKDPFLGKSKSTDSGHKHYGGRDMHCGPYTGNTFLS